MTGGDKYSLFPWLEKKGVNCYLGIKFRDINEKVMAVTTRDGGLNPQADTFITTLPLKNNDEMVNKITGKTKEVYFIDDVKEPKLIADAIAPGALIADSIFT